MKLSLIKINKNGRSPDCVSKSVVLLASEYEYKPKGILPHCTSYMMNTMCPGCPETCTDCEQKICYDNYEVSSALHTMDCLKSI